MAPLPNGGGLLVGGVGSSGLQLAYPFSLHGSAWTAHWPAVVPPARHSAVAVLDAARGNNLLFGGVDGFGAPLADTWLFANGQWSQVVLGAAPSARSEHAMVFHAATGRVLLFGGQSAAGTVLSDMWHWDGTAWSALTPAHMPMGRMQHCMAYDALRSRTVLFGGSSGGSAPIRLDDLWEWDGSDWAQMQVSTWRPSARTQAALAYHPVCERIVLHGGETDVGCADDLWTWDGTTWTQRVVGAAPSPRSGSCMYWDSAARQLRLFGGECGTSESNELWLLDVPVAPTWSIYGQGCAGSLGVPNYSVRIGHEAVLGSTLICDLTNVPTTMANGAFGVLDLQRDHLLGVPIPASLAGVGLPGCFALTGSAFGWAMPPMQSGVGTSFSVSLPYSNGLLGTHLYLQALVLDSGQGRWASGSNGIDVRIGVPIPAPAASFTLMPGTGAVPLAVQFTDASLDACSWQWDFDNDGVTDSTLQNPTHIYSAGGNYAVRLAVSNSSGSHQLVQPGAVIAIGYGPGLDLQSIAPGVFTMGTTWGAFPAEQPQHQVVISYPFWLGKYELTQALWSARMGNNPSFYLGPQQPVEMVDWNMAVSFCQNLTVNEQAAGRVPAGYEYRLPTEAEWEYCCRAGTTSEFYTGGALTAAQANIANQIGHTVPVGSYPANPWGLFDMHGNSLEWCLDAFAPYSAAPQIDPFVTGTGNARVVRSGDFYGASYFARSASRGSVAPTTRWNRLGFRVTLGPVLVP